MFKMFSCLLLLTALLLAPSAPQQHTKTVDQKLADIAVWLQNWKAESSQNQVKITENQVLLVQQQNDFHDTQVGLRDTLEEVVTEAVSVKAQLSELQNLTSEILTDLQVLKGRQAIAGAIAVAQVCMFITYILFCLGIYLVKHCKKRQEKVAKAEFALLEKQLTESRRKRRAAAAAMNKQNPQ